MKTEYKGFKLGDKVRELSTGDTGVICEYDGGVFADAYDGVYAWVKWDNNSSTPDRVLSIRVAEIALIREPIQNFTEEDLTRHKEFCEFLVKRGRNLA